MLFCYVLLTRFVLERRTGYERELHVLLTQLVRDMDRKIERQEDRARKESEPKAVSATEQLELDALKVLS